MKNAQKKFLSIFNKMGKTSLALVIGIPLLAVAVYGNVNSSLSNNAAAEGYGGLPGVQYKTTFSTELLGSNEVPPVTTNTTGDATFNLTMDEQRLDYEVNVYNGMGVTMSNLYCAPAGQNGSVVVPLYSSSGEDVNGTLVSGSLTSSDILPAAAQCNPNIHDLPQLAQAMREGEIYVNVDTTANPSGEVRGQLGNANFIPSPTPGPGNPGNPNPSNSNSQYIILSPYYVTPGQTFNVSGYYFAPNETVTVNYSSNASSTTSTFTTNGSGQLYTNNFTVPFNQENSNVTITVTGSTGDSASATLTVGTFSPFVMAHNYYVQYGTQAGFDGRQFAPNEPVVVTMNGTVVTTITADGGGNFYSQFAAPTTGSSATYTFTGQWSNLSASGTISLYQ